jgi:hypothetical protein
MVIMFCWKRKKITLGFREILDNAIEQKLIKAIESGFELTEQGWKLGSELLEIE